VNLQKVLVFIAMAVAGLLGVLFLLDLAVGIPFDRTSIVLDITLLATSVLILWLGVETYLAIR
jgi:hypothetical protein